MDYLVRGKGGKNAKLGKRVNDFVNIPREWRYGFQFDEKGAWMITQMDRAERAHGNLDYKAIKNEKGRVIGITDKSASGKGKTYYANDSLLEKYGKKGDLLINNHADFKQVQKFVDISAESLKFR